MRENEIRANEQTVIWLRMQMTKEKEGESKEDRDE
jgi:hypothetical protein